MSALVNIFDERRPETGDALTAGMSDAAIKNTV